jgi:lipopolysaccharide transport system permease protein
LPWNFFAMVQNLGMGVMVANAGLVRKVAFPREVLVFAQVGHGIVQFSIEMALLCTVLLIAGSPLIAWLPATILLMALLAVFASGLAMALSALGVYFRDLPYLWTILLQVWFFATPIVYSPTVLAQNIPEWANRLLSYNPMARFVAGFRRTLYDGRAPGWTSIAVLALVSFAALALGWLIFEKLSRRFAEEL